MIEVRKNVRIPIYGGWLYVVVTDEPTVYEAVKRHFKLDDPSLKENNGVVLASDADHRKGRKRDYPLIVATLDPGVIAHEAKHIVNAVFGDLGVGLNTKYDEHETYFLGWVVNEVWKVVKKFEEKKIKENEKPTGIS